MKRQKTKIYQKQSEDYPYIVAETKVNQYITIALILTKKFKTKFLDFLLCHLIRLFFYDKSFKDIS